MKSALFLPVAVLTVLTGCSSDPQGAHTPAGAAAPEPQKALPLTALSQQAPAANELDTGRWRLPPQVPETSIAANLPVNRIYLVSSGETPTSGTTIANVNLKRDQSILALNNTPLDLNQGSLALVEAKNLAVVPARGSTALTLGDYVIKTYEPNSSIQFRWRLNGNNGPILLADLNMARNFRIFVQDVKPVSTTNPATGYLFSVIVDGVALPNLLASSVTSIDVYGKQVVLQLRQYPPASPGQVFSITGSCLSW